MAAKINREFSINTELIKGSRGIFDIVVDGRLIFSKRWTGKFPDEEEVIQLMRQI